MQDGLPTAGFKGFRRRRSRRQRVRRASADNRQHAKNLRTHPGARAHTQGDATKAQMAAAFFFFFAKKEKIKKRKTTRLPCVAVSLF